MADHDLYKDSALGLYPLVARRKTAIFLWAAGFGLFLVALSFIHASLSTRAAAPLLAKRSGLIATLDLTDLALFTEARYTRHPSQADLHSAFQDHPMALEHFPSGSLVPASAIPTWTASPGLAKEGP